MKKILIFMLIIAAVMSLAAKGIRLSSNLNLGFEYDSNVIKLSEDDIDQYLDNEKPEKYEIKALDDLIMQINVGFKLKNYWLGGHTQIHEIAVDYDKYLENSIKDNGFIKYGFKQYFSKKFDMSLDYFYYPQIYLRKYHSVIDDEYHKFEYSKNFYRAAFKWDLISTMSLKYSLELTQLYYSRWFTEYDASVITSNIYFILHPARNSYVTLRYGYRVSEAEAENAYEPDAEISQIKDGSYEANIFGCDIKFKKIIKNIDLNIDYKMESRFYDSEFSGDNYHIEREDYIHALGVNLYKPLKKNLDLKLAAEYGFRNTESPYEYVIDDKEYDYWQTGITLFYDLKLK